jgi:colanic acid biosynthesis protein WcaH
LKRKEEPMKGRWWFPGGAVLFNESLISAVKRRLRVEANIKRIKKIKFLRVKETKFRKGKFDKPIYTINNIFIVDIGRNQVNNIRIDKTSSDYKIFYYIRRSFSPYIKENLKLVGFKYK